MSSDDKLEPTAILAADVLARSANPPVVEEGETLVPVSGAPAPPSTLQGPSLGQDPVDVFGAAVQQAGEQGRFEEVGILGRGGMGLVLEVRDPALGRRVALKRGLQGNDDAMRRFVREAQITSQLEHPNIVPIYDAGLRSDGAPWYAMRKVEGRTLTDVLAAVRDGRDPEWTLQRLLGVFVQVCNAIAYAHDRGVLNRDIKPDNIMVGQFGEVLVLDWGVARLMELEPEERQEPMMLSGSIPPTPIDGTTGGMGTMVGSAVGTAGYMSPEAARGQLDRLGPRSDVFSLGSVLFEIVALSKAFLGNSMLQILFASTREEVEDPRERAPERSIDPELAGIVMRAMQPELRARTRSARVLGQEVQDFLEGRKKRERSVAELRQAASAWERWIGLGEELEGARLELEGLEAATPAWTPRAEKVELLSLRQRVKDLDAGRTERFSTALSAAELSLSHDPTHAAAHSLLADACWQAFLAAEERGDRQGAAAWAARVEAHDDGRYAERLAGQGVVALRSDPPGAEVICERYEQRGLVWALVERRSLGVTPLEVPLAMGSYRLRLLLPGRAVVTYPVHITRARRWEGEPVRMPRFEDLPPGQAFVAGGPTTVGGDPDAQDGLARTEVVVRSFVALCLPVTTAQYAEFLSALHRTDPDQAWARAPRNPSGAGSGGQYWERPGPRGAYVVPEVDRDGDRWDSNWPVMGVCWEDAAAYAAWRAELDGLPWRLPDESEWEKMARGVDGRLYPWGDEFDATLCNMRASHADRPWPRPVGAVGTDMSVYGVRDVAGNQQEFCGDTRYGGNAGMRPARGGAWTSDPMRCRLTWRSGYRPGVVRTVAGFRLVRSI